MLPQTNDPFCQSDRYILPYNYQLSTAPTFIAPDLWLTKDHIPKTALPCALRVLQKVCHNLFV